MPTPAPTRRRLLRTGPALATVAVLALPACSSGGDDAPTDPVPVTRPARTATPTPTAAPDPAASAEPVEVGAAVTPTGPDTYLGATETALLEVRQGFDPANPYYAEAQFTSRLVGVTPADPADLAGVQLDEPIDPATTSVFYLRTAHRLDWARTTTVGTVNPPHVRAWTADGTPAGDLLVFGSFAPCGNGRFEDLTVGTEVETCDIAVLPAGTAPAWAGVEENPQISRDAREQYEAHPVAWQVG